MTTFVLVHGAFRGGWAWNRVRPLLEEAGHEVRTPSLTGMGDRAHLAPAGGGPVRLATWVEDLRVLLESEDLRDVVLVGHSQGGMVLAAAAETVHERLARMVFLDAPVPEHGERGIDLNPPGVPTPDPSQIDLSAALPARPVGPADGFEEPLASWVNDRLCATPIAPSFDQVEIGAAGLAVPRDHVFFARTPTTYPCWSTRARLEARGESFRELDEHHDAPLTAPAVVAAVLCGAG